MKINILTKGFRSPNARGWLYPIVKNKQKLFELGLEISFFLKKSEKVKYCDIVIVESKFVRENWAKDKEKIFELLSSLKTENNKVFFYDLGDSTYSWVLEVLPYVDKFFKTFVFKDKSKYCIPLDGCNILTDYYSKNGSIEPDNQRIPKFINEKDKNLLDKINVGFNYSFANHSLDSTLWKNNFFNKISRRSFIIYSRLLKNIRREDFFAPSSLRLNDISCRMSLNGYSKGIEFHRKQTIKILEKYLSTIKLSRKKYLTEMRNSKIVISPFGWGEINNPRDYEVALCGSLLIKPDLSHINTWPNIFNKDTVVQYKWDLSNLLEIVDRILSSYDDYIEYAIKLQDKYMHYSFKETGQDEFCEYFNNQIIN